MVSAGQRAQRAPRPKAQRLSADKKQQILKTLCGGIEKSPVLSALNIRAVDRRGRFYFERLWEDEDEPEEEVIGRITPLTGAKLNLLLEVR